MPQQLITFREYVSRVVGNPRRGEEFKVLVQLFGVEYLDKIVSGEIEVTPDKLFAGTRER